MEQSCDVRSQPSEQCTRQDAPSNSSFSASWTEAPKIMRRWKSQRDSETLFKWLESNSSICEDWPELGAGFEEEGELEEEEDTDDTSVVV